MLFHYNVFALLLTICSQWNSTSRLLKDSSEYVREVDGFDKSHVSNDSDSDDSDDSDDKGEGFLKILRTARPIDLWVPWHRGDQYSDGNPYATHHPPAKFLKATTEKGTRANAEVWSCCRFVVINNYVNFLLYMTIFYHN